MLSWVPQQRSSILSLPPEIASWASSSFASRSIYRNGERNGVRIPQILVVKNAVTKVKNQPSPSSKTLVKERHKYFDEVMISVRAGDGGNGAILNLPSHTTASKTQGKSEKDAASKLQGKFEKEKPKKKISYKRDFDGSVILPAGGKGGDVIIYADENEDTLLEFHTKSKYIAKQGGNVNSMGAFSSHAHNGLDAPPLLIPVPLGTVVKLKRGKLLADLTNHGDEVVVARGGQGGISLVHMPENKKQQVAALTANAMRDESDKFLVLGRPGEAVNLQLILRIVADVGLVGLPNAGKSTLLSAITLAKPDIADYPFTTLMPNLGLLEGDPALGANQFSSDATIADLPGLIEGAHLGKGLGRNFLRHLRRTRLLVHVVNAATDDPVRDYLTVKEELRMYNPEYLDRPYIVVLNKIDIPEVMEKVPDLIGEIQRIGVEKTGESVNQGTGSCEPLEMKGIEEYPRPAAVVAVSVLKGWRIEEMLREIRSALRSTDS